MNGSSSKEMLTQERLKHFISYCPLTGLFVRIRNHQSAKASTVITTRTKGYIDIQIDNKVYKAHRLAFLYMTGNFPPEFVDHINGNRSDNRFSNLRLATLAENNGNTHTPRGRSGILGVDWDTKSRKWHARIKVDKINHNLGYFNSQEDAVMAYKAAKEKRLAAMQPTAGKEES